MPWRYALIRPLVLLAEGTPTQRAAETHTHPDTVRTFTRRFRAQGMLGLWPNAIEARPRGRAQRVPEAVRHEVDRLKALYAGFHDRELARILFYTFGYPGTHLRRDTVIPQWFQASKAAAASDGHAVHCWVTAVICQLSRLKRIPKKPERIEAL